jgi:multidrug resistance protein MdtO
MASQDQVIPSAQRLNTIDEGGVWFWQFLKTELAPYPGRTWTVARVTISATIVMVIVMTFQIPFGFLAAVYTMLLSREDPTVTLKSGIRSVFSYIVATLYTILGVMLFIGDPMTHFLWIVASLLLAFYLIRVVPDYVTAVGFGFTLAGAIPLWDETYLTVNQRVEDTLWLGFAVIVGITVTITVEYVFRRVHPTSDLNSGIETRLKAVETLLRQIAAGESQLKFQKEIDLYSSLGTSRLRRLLLRSGYSPSFEAQMGAVIGLLGRLVDLAASLQIIRSNHFFVPAAEDGQRCVRLADEIAALASDLRELKAPRILEIPSQPAPSWMPLLPEMERTVALIPQAFAGSDSVSDFKLPLNAVEQHQRLFVADALTNPDHLKFAIRGTLATMLAYCSYTIAAWPGLSTAVATTIITALSTIGASRQKQFLRLVGAFIGGFCFGMGAQVFILPHLDSITGFAVLFAVVVAISAWLSTATPKLSYLGIQLALAFFLINLQEFAPQYSLAIARDRVVGVLLGLLCMWLVFDRLWVKDALQEMQELFARNLELMAELVDQCRTPDRTEAVKRTLQLRDRINEGFNGVKAQSDAVVFEFGPSRRRKLKIRDDFRLWQPTLGILLQVQITYLQYIFHSRLPDIPPEISDAAGSFEQDVKTTLLTMADYIACKPPRTAPDLLQSATTLREKIDQHYSGSSVPPALYDMITLTQNLASVVAPLYRDVEATFANPQQARMHHPHAKVFED